MCLREIWRLELIRTIPQSTRRGRFDRKCKGMQHPYAAPVNQAHQKELGCRRFESLCAGCGQVEGEQFPCESEFVLCKRCAGMKYCVALLGTSIFLEANLAFPPK
ncbi:unnamed protein product [Parnassius mnemosyne]|uniref:Uncharacterized protein n=1 Tax=Parnassius mnemosyne TaxID=213953 RepID=A0AAV1M643_9NEOP